MLKQNLQEELRQSTLAKDELKTSVLRLLLSSINYYEIEKGAQLSDAERARLRAKRDKGGRYEATDDDVLTVIQREIKQRKDSIEHFESAGRQELVNKETKEMQILQSYLPEQLSEEEIRKVVDETIREVEAKSIQDMGKVMGALMPKIKGKADVGLVSQIVKEKLS